LLPQNKDFKILGSLQRQRNDNCNHFWRISPQYQGLPRKPQPQFRTMSHVAITITILDRID